MRNFYALVAVGVLGLFLGCGGSEANPDRPETVPVTITVMQGGNAVAGATVNFIPAGNASGHAGSAITDDNGQAEVRTFETGDGLVPGEYNVTVVKMATPPQTGSGSEDEGSYQPPAAGEPAPVAKSSLPEKYSQPASSPLKATIPSTGEAQELTFELD